MAYIDKTYGTKAQSEEVFAWLKRHRPKFLRYHYGVDIASAISEDEMRPILNTPVSVDKWLARYCPLPVVLSRFMEVYNPNHVVYKWAALAMEARQGQDPQGLDRNDDSAGRKATPGG